MKVIFVEPMKEPYVKEIDSGLESLQNAVGGYIQAIYPFPDPVAIICDEEGKINGKQLNRALRDDDNTIYDIIAGTFIIAGLSCENFDSLTAELTKKYMEAFKTPEFFMISNGKIIALPVI